MELTMNDKTDTILENRKAAPGRKGLWTGRIMSGLMVLFLLFDAAGKLLRLRPVVEGTAKLGFPTGVIVPLGLVLLACVVLYLIPRTALLGAVLLTGYLGGAVATHVRADDPLFSHTLFPIYVGVMIWGGLALRDTRVRTLIAPRRRG
jgi:hypothetical protein